jgi:hypothetical protein
VSNNSELPGCFLAAGIICALLGSGMLALICFVCALLVSA